MQTRSWRIEGAEGETILGESHLPQGPARAVCPIVHGFLGYKDYGLFPRLAHELAQRGCIAHRFNLSHSGMTGSIERFERPDLFTRDTWMKQVRDLDAVIDAAEAGEIPGEGLPLIPIGHSRGGVTVLLNAGRRFESGRGPLPRALATLAAPDTACTWDERTRSETLARGFAEVRSNRTGQTLRIDAGWLQEQLDNPAAHDVIAHVRKIACPMLFVHGEEDQTVESTCAHRLAAAAGERGRLVVLPGADHVFNTANPFGLADRPSGALQGLLDAVAAFCERAAQS